MDGFGGLLVLGFVDEVGAKVFWNVLLVRSNNCAILWTGLVPSKPAGSQWALAQIEHLCSPKKKKTDVPTVTAV